jgi:hypothetical protein
VSLRGWERPPWDSTQVSSQRVAVASLPSRPVHGCSSCVHAVPQLTTTLRACAAHGFAESLARRGSMGSVSIDGSIFSSAAVGGSGTAPHTPVPGTPHSSINLDGGDARTPQGADIGTLFPQRDATGPGPSTPADGPARMLEPSVTASSDGDRHIVQQQAQELDERLERLRKREAELAALVAQERENAAREERRREQMVEQNIATKQHELMQAHNRRSAHFLPNGKFGADVGAVDRPFLRSQPGATQPLRSAAAAAEEEARREIAARAQDPEYGATMIQAAFRGHAARRVRSQRAADSARRTRTKVPAVFREIHSEGGGRARILAVATLTDPAQVIGCPLANDISPQIHEPRQSLHTQHRGSRIGFMPEARDSVDYATAAHVRNSPGRGRRPVAVHREEQVHQDRLAQVHIRVCLHVYPRTDMAASTAAVGWYACANPLGAVCTATVRTAIAGYGRACRQYIGRDD